MAPAISVAFSNAADGFFIFCLVRRYSRTSATAPAVSGVTILVPPIKKYFLLGVNGAQAVLFGAIMVDRVDKIKVPGATTSGLKRLSRVGPRLLNATTWSGL